MNMESCRFCSVSDRISGSKYVCHTRRKHEGFKVSVTDAADCWTVDIADEALEKFMQKLSLKSPEDLCHKLSSGDVCLGVKNELAQLRLVTGSNPALLDLTKMDAVTAKQEVKQLLFKMADSLSQSAARDILTTTPVKNNQRRAPDFEPRQQNSAPCVTAKRRVPGSSLINPGTKKKREATGVAFDDPDED
ncbi:unnamed protein product [Knipowitschia caucasica]|uniref:Uncharacterized protein n=1 Tax=Knipowitschia caucasica TaxID=637954 RepID=A0AAV2MNL6_KNICA